MSEAAELIRSRRVVDRRSVHEFGVTYSFPRPEDGEHRSKTVLTIDYETYEDLGLPSQVTVSVEPGNRLEEEANYA